LTLLLIEIEGKLQQIEGQYFVDEKLNRFRHPVGTIGQLCRATQGSTLCWMYAKAGKVMLGRSMLGCTQVGPRRALLDL
jgi:hypothetical protein